MSEWETIGSVSDDGWETVSTTAAPSIAPSKGVLRRPDELKPMSAFEMGMQKAKEAITEPFKALKPEKKELIDVAKATGVAATEIAPWVLVPELKGAGLLMKSGALGGVMGLSSGVKSLIEGEGLSKSGIRAGVSGTLGTAAGVALGGIAKAGGATYKALEKTAVGQKAIREIDKRLSDLGHTTDVINQYISEKTANIAKYIGKRTEQAAEVSGGEFKKILDAASTDIQDATLKISKKLDKTVSAVEHRINLEYDKITEGELGRIPVNVSQELNMIAKTAGSAKAKDLFPKLAAVYPADKAWLEGLAEKNLKDIPLKDAHRLKKLLYKYAKNTTPGGQDTGAALREGVRIYREAIDIAAGGEYAAISQKYKGWIDSRDDVTNKLGEVVSVAGEKFLKGSMPVANKIAELLSEGKDITSEFIYKSNAEVMAVRDVIYQLEQFSMEEPAQAIRNSVEKLANATLSKRNIESTIKWFDDLAKEKPEQFFSDRVFQERLAKLKSEAIQLRKQRAESKYAAAIDKEKNWMENFKTLGMGVIGWELSSFMPKEVRPYLRTALVTLGLAYKAPEAAYPLLKYIKDAFIEKAVKMKVKDNVIRAFSTWIDYSMGEQEGEQP